MLWYLHLSSCILLLTVTKWCSVKFGNYLALEHGDRTSRQKLSCKLSWCWAVLTLCFFIATVLTWRSVCCAPATMTLVWRHCWVTPADSSHWRHSWLCAAASHLLWCCHTIPTTLSIHELIRGDRCLCHISIILTSSSSGSSVSAQYRRYAGLLSIHAHQRLLYRCFAAETRWHQSSSLAATATTPLRADIIDSEHHRQLQHFVVARYRVYDKRQQFDIKALTHTLRLIQI